ncbi:hypothetical protein SCAR479_00675 [Seiridium cardinale]|uniref:Uncharacterized protein n=1 Tax=Seiridium cardinale TaxID=138064 RepID=A0ABR2YAT3_9PEZI
MMYLLPILAGLNPKAEQMMVWTWKYAYPAGTDPVAKFSTEYLGPQHTDNGQAIGIWASQVSSAGIGMLSTAKFFGSAEGVPNPDKDTDGFHGGARDSLSKCTADDPLKFVPHNESWGETSSYVFGRTSLVETDDSTGTGAVFSLVVSTITPIYLWSPPLIRRYNADENELIGAGLAQVELVDGTPTVTYHDGENGWWWNAASTPRYGDGTAYRDTKSE